MLAANMAQVEVSPRSDKTRNMASEVGFMGHIISSDGLKADPEKVQAAMDMPKPSNKKEVLSLLGFINYLARFLPKLADVAHPLRELTKKMQSSSGLNNTTKALKRSSN